MSFSIEANGQQTSKSVKKELKKQRKAKQRAAAEERRNKALFSDADFHDEEDEELELAITSEPKKAEVFKSPIIEEPASTTAVIEATALGLDSQIENYACSLQGIPYRFGGMDDKGFDCSGFSYHVFAQSGVQLPRTAQAQFNSADIIPLRKVTKGDLLFFGKNKRKISHVGIVISSEGEPLRMVHAASSGGIMITDLDASAYWKARLLSAGRYLSPAEIRAAR
jgi:cell wall-associated NlpC family hydrolase